MAFRVAIICSTLSAILAWDTQVIQYVRRSGTGSIHANVLILLMLFANTKFCVFGPVR